MSLGYISITRDDIAVYGHKALLGMKMKNWNWNRHIEEGWGEVLDDDEFSLEEFRWIELRTT